MQCQKRQVSGMLDKPSSDWAMSPAPDLTFILESYAHVLFFSY